MVAELEVFFFLTEVSDGIGVPSPFLLPMATDFCFVTPFPAFSSLAKFWPVAVSISGFVARYSAMSENPITCFRRQCRH